MNISIIGPEGSGKTTLGTTISKKAPGEREVLFVGKKRSEFRKVQLEDLYKLENKIVIIDDANAYLESYDVYNKNLHLKEPFILHRESNMVFIAIFHSFDDAVKYFFRQSRYIYVSTMYKDEAHLKNKYIKGLTPELIGQRKWWFNKFKRY